jgi:hypothetical protein
VLFVHFEDLYGTRCVFSAAFVDNLNYGLRWL